jgi:isopenicillin N synthase-like dioxygenase
MLTTSDAPSIDLDDLHTDDAARKDAAAAAILHGYGHFGLVTIAGHGIDPHEVDAFYADFISVTERPEAEKSTWHRSDIWYQRGWTPPNTEGAVVAGGRKDFKECWFAAPLAADPDAAASFPELYAENVFPDDLPSFASRYVQLGAALHDVGAALLRGAERALDLDAGTFDELIGGGAHLTRALRYLSVSPEDLEANVLWGEEHTDFNLLTVLAGGRFYDPGGRPTARPDDRSGLYLRTRPTPDHPRGQMVPGRPPPGHIVSQVGQQLEILTGGLFLATPHVIKPPHATGWTRTSLAHFVHVNPLKTLAPLPPFRTPEAISAYRPPSLAGTYAIKTLVDIKLAPPTALDGLGYRHYGRLAGIRAEGEW